MLLSANTGMFFPKRIIGRQCPGRLHINKDLEPELRGARDQFTHRRQLDFALTSEFRKRLGFYQIPQDAVNPNCIESGLGNPL
ncbi:hypothetical protein SDC9_117278 [bioreactor metagenome]|uniref:Uncharacterized protein n=1 Tax=bioreactor metagenome TaxID=1076179 RepID=A0A645C4P6_9ZZZZ